MSRTVLLFVHQRNVIKRKEKMGKLKVGSKALCVNKNENIDSRLVVGVLYTVSSINSGDLYLVELDGKWTAEQFKLHQHPNPPHKHCELIKDWADGAEIEMLDNAGYWQRVMSPRWDVSIEYRIKPEKSDKDIEIERIESEMRKLADALSKVKSS
jgi:hypothetical protein